MSHRRLSTLVLSLAVIALAGAPSAHAEGEAGSITKAAGTVSATLSWDAGKYFVTHPRLVVSRAGAVASDLSLADVCHECQLQEDSPESPQFSDLKVADLDGDGEPEVLVDTFSGGAHCCVTARIYAYRPATNSYRRVSSPYWGNSYYELTDLDHNGTLELSGFDDSFAYAFASYAASAFPVKVEEYSFDQATGKATLKNVTRRYPALIRTDAARLLRFLRGTRIKTFPKYEGQGILAAYVAEEYLLGKGAVGKAEIARARRHGLTGPGFQTGLLKFLRQTGYR